MHVFKYIFNELYLLTKKQKYFILTLLAFLSLPMLYSLKLIPALDLFYINTTKSAPLGIYVAADNQRLQIGDYVIMNVPEEMKPYIYGRGWATEKRLLKQISGLSMETYEVKNDCLIINGRTAILHSADQENLPLPKLPNGRYRVPIGKFMPVSLDRENSFDARYTGPVDQVLIIKKVVPFITLPNWLENYV